MAWQTQWNTKVVMAWHGIVEDVAWHIWWNGMWWCPNDDITKVVMAWHGIVEDVAWHIWWHGIWCCPNDDVIKVHL